MKIHLCLSVLLFVVFSGCYVKKEHSIQPSFSTPAEAIVALASAAREGDVVRLEALLGTGGGDILFSGDPVADQADLARFYGRYEQKGLIERSANNRYTLVVGDDQWPFPIPVVAQGARWRFDGAAGLEEILNRRIGGNELWAIDACRSYVDAQRIYAAKDHNGDRISEYAQQIISDRGAHNGLFWVRGPGEPHSPLDAVIARAITEGYQRNQTGRKPPVHGYFYRVITAQGSNVAGGRKSYLSSHGQLTGGFALLAYPATWGNSGIMSFLVNQDGVVYQKDLGAQTTQLAEQTVEYNPDSSWSVVE